MKHNVLLVEDSPEIFTIVNQALSGLVHLLWAKTVSEARGHLSAHAIDLILLDIELPDGNGIEFCSELQSKAKAQDLPIFILTAKGELSEKVLGFSAGAEDYIVKPFAPLELKARVEAKLKRLDVLRQNSSLLKWAELEIDKNRQEVHILSEGQMKKVDLTSLEFKLLMYFANKPGYVISREEVLNEIWGQDVHVYPRSVDTHISKLRKKLGEAARILESVHGTGYKFSPTQS